MSNHSQHYTVTATESQEADSADCRKRRRMRQLEVHETTDIRHNGTWQIVKSIHHQQQHQQRLSDINDVNLVTPPATDTHKADVKTHAALQQKVDVKHSSVTARWSGCTGMPHGAAKLTHLKVSVTVHSDQIQIRPGSSFTLEMLSGQIWKRALSRRQSYCKFNVTVDHIWLQSFFDY